MAKMVTPEMVKINKRVARETRRTAGKPASPGREAWLRLKRNRLAIVGTIFILGMFAFAFIGGILSPYGESEVFRGYEEISKDYASVTENTEFHCRF